MTLETEKVKAEVKDYFSKIREILKQAESQFDKDDFKGTLTSLDTAFSKLRYQMEFLISYLQIHSHKWRPLGDAKPDEVAKLAQLNSALRKVEKKILAEEQRIKAELAEQLQNKDEPFLKDYEVDVEVQYYLDENHPDYDENRDNIIAEQKYLSLERRDEEVNWSEFYGKDHPLKNQRHCYMFHDLYDHVRPKLSLDDLLRIKMVWVDIVVLHQSSIELEAIEKINLHKNQ